MISFFRENIETNDDRHSIIIHEVLYSKFYTFFKGVAMKKLHIFVMAMLAVCGLIYAQEEAVDVNQAESRLEQAMDDMSKVKEENKAYARNYFDIAKGQYEKFRYEEAKENLKLALRYDPEYKEAAALLEKVQALLGERPDKVRTFYEWALKEQKVKVQQRKIEMENLIDEGKMLYKKEDYEAAAEKFESALQIHRWMPYKMEFPELKKEATSLYEQAKKRAADAAIEDKKRRQEKAQREAIERLKQERELEERRIKGLFERLKNAYYNKADFDLAKRLAEEILSIDPNNKVAWEWKWDASNKKHNQREARLKAKNKEEMRNLDAQLEESLIPQTSVIEYPEGWLEMVKDRIAPGIGPVVEDEWKRKIMDQMEKRVSFDFLETPLEQVVQFLTKVTGIAIVLDPAALVDDMGTPMPQNVTLKVDEMRFSSALNWILRLTNLKMTLRDEAIFIGKDIDTDAFLRIYDVRDLTVQPQDMPGPNIELVAGEADIAISSFADQDQSLDLDAIKELIEGTIRPEIWSGEDDRVGIDVSGGKLVVTAPNSVHEMIQQLLDNFRQQNVLQVSVLCKFLQVNDNFMDDIGVNIKNWNPSGTQNGSGPIPGIDNVFTPYGDGAITGGDPAAGAAGGSYTDFEVYDGAGSYDLGWPAVNTPFVTGLYNTNTEILTGMWLDYTVSNGSIYADFRLHAVEAQMKGKVLAAPRLTVFNNQRAHILTVTQNSYIRDVTPVVATSATSFDPEIDTYTTGTVLDVRPTVSSDRKYITLEVRPTQAILQRMTTYPVTGSWGSSATIQLPSITVQRVRTNAVIPDGGSIVLGGLNTLYQGHQRQGIPFLSHIPFIGRLFGRDLTYDEQAVLMIIIKCKITLFKELEAEL